MEKKSTFPHNGKMLEEYIDQHCKTKTEAARQLGVVPSLLHGYLQNESLSFKTLWKASIVFNHNFIADLAAHVPVETSNNTTQDSINEAIEELKKEITLLKEFVFLQKSKK